MLSYIFATLAVIEGSSRHCAENKERDNIPGGFFPDNFLWCAATASFQIEGGVKQDGRGDSIWDEFGHYRGPLLEDDSDPRPEDPDADCGADQCFCMIDECENGDIACDSYNNLERDIQLLINLNVKMYRFSLSWPRLMPDGRNPNTNDGGLNYYNKLIDLLIENDIIPMVTLYHWDLPINLSPGDRFNFDECHGWDCVDIVEDFANYADYCFEQFGDRVKHWITLNEPEVFVDEGYNWCEMAPGVCGDHQVKHRARHNTVLAHAKAYDVYNSKYRAQQNGIIGITLNSNWYQPEDPKDPLDILASESAMAVHAGWWAYPIFGDNGDYSELMKEALQNKNQWSDNLVFTEAEMKLNKNSSDFFGLNHYSSEIVEYTTDGYKYRTLSRCKEWPSSGSDWLYPCPWAFRELLKFIHNRWSRPIYVTENGISSSDSTNGTDHEPNLNDQFRVNFYNEYIGQMHRAIVEDGVDIQAYTAWSLMDNLEWARGYTERFGMHWTNYTDPNRAVYRKASADWYSEVAENNCVPCMGTQCDIDCTDTASAADTPSAIKYMGLLALMLFY